MAAELLKEIKILTATRLVCMKTIWSTLRDSLLTGSKSGFKQAASSGLLLTVLPLAWLALQLMVRK